MNLGTFARKGVLAVVLTAVGNLFAADLPPLPPDPPQDRGLPYTRTSHPDALAKIANCVAIFPGSRFAYVKGMRVRLDDKAWHDEAIVHEGTLYVPQAFLPLIAANSVKADVPPDYLLYRWVYSVDRPETPVPAGVSTMDVDGDTYIDIVAAATKLGLTAYTHPRGFTLIGSSPPKLQNIDAPHLDAIVTLFDTPEKFADPDIATQYVPTLKRQGKWTEHVKVSPEQLKSVNGLETKWPTTPQSDYDYTGFNQKLLGSPVPPPGVYPRILFSPDDVPTLAERIKATTLGKMGLMEMQYLFEHSWWDAKTSDGQILEKLASGDLSGLNFDVPPGTSPTAWPQTFKDEKPGIYNSHVAYIPECLTAMSLYCLLTNDDVHGRLAASAIANWYKLREPLIDEVNAISDSEFGGVYKRADGDNVQMDGNGSETTWRTQAALVAHMNLGLSLDFAGKWMNADQKDTMRRIIVKSTYGRRAYGQDGPLRFRDVNWVAWDLPDYLAVLAIEGLPGCDREVLESNAATVSAFCDWGIDDSGVIYESNGKTPGSLQFQTLSMVALARRGTNLFGHPHWRKLLTGQIQMTSPNGRVTVNSGTQYTPFSQSWLSMQMVDEEKAFFPGDRRPDYMLARAAQYGGLKDEAMREWVIDGFDADQFRADLPKRNRLRLPSPSYPGFVQGVLYDADFIPTTRADLKLPLDFNTPVHGVFSSYSDDTPNAAWIDMMVRPDIYLGAGHHHADAGQVHFSALGVDWFTQTQLNQNYEGKLFTLVRVDGHSEAESNPDIASGYIAAPKYLGASSNENGGIATADLTNAYSYRWTTQPPQAWTETSNKLGWKMDPSPEIAKLFAGTAHYKMRPWWANYNYVNYIATSRAEWNPMQYVYRSAGLLRGKHPIGLVVDDLKKDEHPHLYQWQGTLNGPVWQAKVDGLPDGSLVLGLDKGASDQKACGFAGKPPLVPQEGDPLLWVCPLGLENGTNGSAAEVGVEPGAPDRKGLIATFDRLLINHHGNDAHFKVLLIPFRSGDVLPKVTYDTALGNAKVNWSDESDELTFAAGTDGRCKVSALRDGQIIAQSN